eukprot:TRINITY_DN21120_c0_g1_i1.p1 TRINITY_DN21120_c0_g1~~TRINITY_DN21120_c0_g1_i1.p1  ORF type:complete len:110 (+),score=4.93 TRINITY_DN21120_c0_g1_i1:1-330(+)
MLGRAPTPPKRADVPENSQINRKPNSSVPALRSRPNPARLPVARRSPSRKPYVKAPVRPERQKRLPHTGVDSQRNARPGRMDEKIKMAQSFPVGLKKELDAAKTTGSKW